MMKPIILASGSSSRRAMLEAANVAFTSIPPNLDEDAITEKLSADGTGAGGIAEALADAKASAVSARHPDALVIGADQVLVCGKALINKARDESEARQTLTSLRGREHKLIAAAVIATGGSVVWRAAETVTMRMRDFSDAFLDAYLEAELPGLLGSVGCYRIEGLGAQLFEKIDGDTFVIRGLPLIPLLGALRKFGGLQS